MISKKALVGVAALAVSALGVPAANAAQPGTAEFAQAQSTAINQAEQVSDALGTSTGGYYLDGTTAVVTVLDSAAAKAVQSHGLVARTVKHSLATLNSAKASLDAITDVPQTAWGIDPVSNQVVVTIYDAASKASRDKVTAAAQRLGDTARIEHQTGRLELHIADGDAIRNSQGRCSLGFNVKQGSTPYLLTAGHCTNLGGTWSGGDVTGARIVHSDCPGADSGLLTRPNGTGPGRINTGQAITSAGKPTVGQRMQKQGSTTGGGSGQITSVDQTVNFDVGVLRHEFGTTAHTDHGDSGGPAYSGSVGLGTLSGGNTTVSYFYPLQLELQSYGLTLA
ncbi:S1 family peptidase [Kutzneria viridogrisea]|uniref:Streptogrisin D n=1 Tax=Kutzneria viridogrisea TaxID=47990 RepID=A0ABR6BU57_9PSEU|nr:streptogrisin D [Kutzneria viridogrisea]